MTGGARIPSIREEDIEARAIHRRAFLGRFGAATGVASLIGFTTGCERATCDSDQSDPIISDSDQSDTPTFDMDVGDTCDDGAKT